MEEIVYLLVRLACVSYLLYKVWGLKKKVHEICSLLYMKKPCTAMNLNEPEISLLQKMDEPDVMGSTRYVYLDENAGQTIAPYMSEPLEMSTDYIGEDEEIPEEEVKCNISLEEIKVLKEEQEALDGVSPEVDAISQIVTTADLDNAGNVLFRLDGADKDEEKSRRAAITLYSIRETDLFEVFSSQVENKSIIENLIEKYLDKNDNVLFAKKKRESRKIEDDWRSFV